MSTNFNFKINTTVVLTGDELEFYRKMMRKHKEILLCIESGGKSLLSSNSKPKIKSTHKHTGIFNHE